jgi:colanic acid biosynthesis glycosyl transferase WcaI
MMRLLMLAPYYAPDLGPSAPLFTMLAEELARRGHQVTVIAAVPHYPTGSVPEKYRQQHLQRSTENGVAVIRVRIPSVQRASLARRALQYASYQLSAAWACAGLQCDAVFAANPALWVWLPYAFTVGLRRKPAVFSVHDVYPDVGVTLGVFKSQFVIAAVRSLERFCLHHAAHVRILSESFRTPLHTLGVSDSKLVLVFDWVDTELIQPLPKENPFSIEHHLDRNFIVQYAGNIGLSQGLEHMLSAAEMLTDHFSIKFVFVGDGAGKASLLADAEQRNLHNVQFIPFQPRTRLPEVLASADVALVMLKRGIGSGSLPSKTFSALASGCPVIASVDEGSETWNLLQRAEAGLCIPPEDPGALAQAILTLHNDPALRERLGANGREWALKYHSPQSAADQFERLFLALASKNKTPL